MTQAEMEATALEVWKDQPGCTEFWDGFSARRIPGGKILCRQHLAAYSTDMQAAMKLLEQTASRYTIRKIDGTYECVLHMFEGNYETADTMPHAIALACLAALSRNPKA